MSEIQLVPVQAYYYNAGTDQLQALDPANALLAADFAPKWKAWNADVASKYGWAVLVSPPAAGSTYTRAMFRSPEDQQALQASGLAAALDASPHQAGRAVDVDLYRMEQIYPNYNYSDLVAAAKRHGIFNRVANEPWHFDDDPADIFGSTRAAIEAIGNLKSQVQQLVAQGLDSPQVAAVKAYLGTGSSSTLTLILVMGLAYAGWKALTAPPAREKGRA